MAPDRSTPTSLFLLLGLPFGVTGGYIGVTLAYQLAHVGISVASIAGLIAIGLLPHTWKVVWAPIIDTTLSSKAWYLIGAAGTALGLLIIALVPVKAGSLLLFQALAFAANFAVTFLGMAGENLMAQTTSLAEKGRVGGWWQAGSLGGTGLSGSAGLWIAQHSGVPWLAGAALAVICLVCCAALLLIQEPRAEHRKLGSVFASLFDVAKDVWRTARSRSALLALLICFLPIGSGAASNLWPALARDWHVSADTVAIVNGALGGLASVVGCVIGGHLCDRLDRQAAYAIYGALLALCAVAMGFAPRAEMSFVVFTLLYAVIVGMSYAAFSAVVLEAIGRGAAATKYNLYASLSNIPIAYMTVVDGFTRTHWNAGVMLFAEAAIGGAGIAIFVAAGVISKPRQDKTASAPA